MYTALKVEAARTGRYAKDIVAEALIEWFEAKEDAELSQGLDEVWAELQRDGGVDAETVFAQFKTEVES